MAETRGAVVITAALISAAATIIVALIARSDGDNAAPSDNATTSASPPASSVVEGTSTPPGPAEPEPLTPKPPAPEQAAPPVQALPGDLGLSRPITRPACDGSFVIFLGAATYPPTYHSEVQHLLDTYSGSEYLRAGDTCPSLRSRDSAGNHIYGVYYGPFASREQACQERNAQSGESYVKVLDTVTEPSVIIEC